MVGAGKRRKFRRVPQFKGQTLSKLIPNLITVGATCAGLTGVKYALDEKWEFAMIAIIVAGVLDGLDGRMARLLKSASDFGAELDSLSDFAAFGVSPALIMYFWSLESLGRFGWPVALFLVICCGFRLARFNTNLGKLPPYAYNYFTGVPAPMAAGLAILPMIASTGLEADILREPAVVAIWLIFVALLMVSRLPTYAFKQAKIPHAAILPILVVFGVLVALLTVAPWRTLTVVGVFYLLSFPASVYTYLRLKAEAERMQDARDEEDDSEDGDGSEPGEREDGSPILREV